jgi:hypothetical protein
MIGFRDAKLPDNAFSYLPEIINYKPFVVSEALLKITVNTNKIIKKN